jgi:hypothetical protein
MTVKHRAGETTVTPFVLDWEKYNQPANNGFFAAR